MKLISQFNPARIPCFATFALTKGGGVRHPLAFPNEAS